MENAPKDLADRVLFPLDIVVLLVIFDQRDRDQQPPDGGDAKADDFAHERRDQHKVLAQTAGEDVGNQRDDERDARADIAPGIAIGRHAIHALLGGHVVEHRVVERERRLIEHLGDHIQDEEQNPAPRNAVQKAADHADGDGGGEENLLGILAVGKRAEDRPEQRDDDCDDRNRGGIGAGGGGLRQKALGSDAGRDFLHGKRFEPDRDQRTGEHGIGGVADVIQHPRKLLRAEVAEHPCAVQPTKKAIHAVSPSISMIFSSRSISRILPSTHVFLPIRS